MSEPIIPAIVLDIRVVEGFERQLHLQVTLGGHDTPIILNLRDAVQVGTVARAVIDTNLLRLSRELKDPRR